MYIAEKDNSFNYIKSFIFSFFIFISCGNVLPFFFPLNFILIYILFLFKLIIFLL
jgi:hypothetical protein